MAGGSGELRFCDVLVVGGGGSGMAAAIAAADAGASVIVLEAGKKAGGSTALSAGVFYAAGTSVQRAAGIEDDADRMFHYYMTLNQWTLEPWLIRRFCDQSAPVLEWLIGLGVEYPPELLYLSGVDDTPRGHQTPGGGMVLFERLLGAADARGVQVHCDVRVDELLVEDGKVVGVVAQGAEMRAGAVIVTTGGLGSNWGLMEEYYPKAIVHGPEHSFFFGAQTVRGDGHIMGRNIGAAIVGKNRGSLNITPGFSRDVAAFFPSWLVMVNAEGRRFMDETIAYAVSGDFVYMQTGHRCFGIFDEAARLAAGNRHPLFDRVGVGDYAFSSDRLLQEAQNGKVKVADSLEELAALTGIHAAALVGTADAYNEDVALGEDRRFGKKGTLMPISTGPFYAVEILPSSWGNTGAGLRVDPDGHVISTSERIIEGLYAGGEATGGIFGDRYIGGGNAIAHAIIFGKIAGESAAQYVKSTRMTA
jgi:fumarate reductase flavoprotein subunit